MGFCFESANGVHFLVALQRFHATDRLDLLVDDLIGGLSRDWLRTNGQKLPPLERL